MAYSFDTLRKGYSDALKRMTVRQSHASAIVRAAATLRKGKARYEAVEAATGVPWKFIAVLHWRESSGDFRGVLHNGEYIIGTGRKTELVPAGRGPFSDWSSAAADALTLKGLHRITDWSLERICYEGERFNGFGYRKKGLPSPYLWSGSNQYARGKYVADGKFSPTTVDQQLGIIPIYLQLASESYTAQPSVPSVPPVTQQTVTVLERATLAFKAVATALGSLFALDNLTATRDWLGATASYFPPRVIAMLLVGAALMWVATKLIQKAHAEESAEPDNLKTGDENA